MEMIKKIIPLGLLFTPLLAFAISNLDELMGEEGFLGIIDSFIKVLIGLAVVFFLYGVVKFITSGGDEEKRKEGKNLIIYGIISIFVMVSIWGLVNILAGTFNLGTEQVVNKSINGALPW
jgi:fumarate reductase subunit D